jgi:hypothetical protein
MPSCHQRHHRYKVNLSEMEAAASLRWIVIEMPTKKEQFNDRSSRKPATARTFSLHAGSRSTGEQICIIRVRVEHLPSCPRFDMGLRQRTRKLDIKIRTYLGFSDRSRPELNDLEVGDDDGVGEGLCCVWDRWKLPVMKFVLWWLA